MINIIRLDQRPAAPSTLRGMIVRPACIGPEDGSGPLAPRRWREGRPADHVDLETGGDDGRWTPGAGYARRPRGFAAHAVCGALGLITSTPAGAQLIGGSLATAAEDNSVDARSREKYDPTGVPIGAFRLFATADAKLSFDNNVFNIEAPRQSDRTAVLAPRVILRLQTPRYDLSLTADASVERFDKRRAENNEQYNVAADGAVRFGSSGRLAVDGFYGLRQELRGTLGDVVIGAPNRYDRSGGSADVAFDLANLTVSASLGVEKLDYKPVRLEGATIRQDFRDNSTYTGTARTSLQLGPGLRLVGQAAYNQQRYRMSVDTIDRDSHGYSVLGGVAFGVTGLISGEAGLGYLSQTYEQGPVRTVDGVSYRAKIVWNPTTLLTATVTGGRTLEQSPFFNQAGVIQDQVGAIVDYELLRNLIISASERVTFNNFRGLGRRDRLFTSDVSARYLISRSFEAGLQLNHRHQSSEGPLARRYAGTSVTISLIVKR